MNYPLKDLAQFTEYDGQREGMMIRCPNCRMWGSVHFEESEFVKKYPAPTWKRTGETLETISLHPSVRMIGHFHSWVTEGELRVDSPFECTPRAPESDVPEEGKVPA